MSDKTEEKAPIVSQEEVIQIPQQNENPKQVITEETTQDKEQNQQTQENKNQSVIYFIIVVVALVIIGAALYYFYSEAKQNEIKEIDLKSRKYDSREYKLVQLQNDLKVLVIKDKDLQEAAIAMNVGVGSFSAPKEFPGLAHFLEHMLFMGSEKYPNTQEFPDFITTNDGTFNAYTAYEQTNFFFSVPYNAFNQGMDIFSRFFIDPLLSQKNINSEIDAISNEFEIALTNPNWQTQFALQQISNKSHPFSRFQCGNHESLMINPMKQGKNVYNAMEDFYRKEYSANIMSMVVISKEDTEKMLEVINKKFEDVKNNQVSYKTFNNSGRIFEKQNLGQALKFVSSSSDYTLSILFEFEEVITKYNEQPLDFIDYFISYDGKNSLKQVLQEKGWIYDLDTGVESNTGSAFYVIQFTLSDAGTENIEGILQLFFSHIDLIKKKGITEKYYQEVRQIANISFQYSDKFDVLQEAHRCAKNMQYFPLELALLGQSMFEKYDEKMIRKYLDGMTPENGIFTFSSSQLGEEGKNNKENLNKTEKNEDNDNKESIESKEKKDNNKESNENKEKKDDSKNQDKKGNDDDNTNLMFQSLQITNFNQKKLLLTQEKKQKKITQKPQSKHITQLLQLKQFDNISPLYPIDNDQQFQQKTNENSTGFLHQSLQTIPIEDQQQLTIQKPNNKGKKPDQAQQQDNNNQNESKDQKEDKKQQEEEKKKEDNSSKQEKQEKQNGDINFLNLQSSDSTWNYSSLYRLNYTATKLSEKSLKKLQEQAPDSNELQLPEKNSFIPKDIELIPTCLPKEKLEKKQKNCVKQQIKDDDKKDYPNLIIINDKMEVWHKLDRSFQQPKVSMELLFSSPVAYKNEESIAINKLFVKLLNEKINQELNDALSIGYEIDIQSSLSGINIEIFGFREKFSDVIKTISTIINDFQCDEKKLELSKEELKKEMQESLQEVTSQAIIHFKTIMMNPTINAFEIKDKINDIDKDQVMKFKENLFKKGFVTGICIGNILENDVKEIFNENFKSIIKYKPVKNFDQLYEYKWQVTKLKNRSIVIRMPNMNKNSNNSLLLNYYQIGINSMQTSEDYENFLKMHILQNIIHSEAFNILRTEMQLGYSVGAFLFPLDNVNGIVILIQGSKNLPDENDKIVESIFLNKVGDIISNMNLIEFELIKESFKSQLLQKDLKLRDRKDRYFSIINSQLYDFDIMNSILESLNLLTLEKLQDYYKEIFGKKNGRISYQIFSNKKKDQINKNILEKDKMYSNLKNEVYYQDEKITKKKKFQRKEIQELKNKLKQFQ